MPAAGPVPRRRPDRSRPGVLDDLGARRGLAVSRDDSASRWRVRSFGDGLCPPVTGNISSPANRSRHPVAEVVTSGRTRSAAARKCWATPSPAGRTGHTPTGRRWDRG